MNQDKTTGQTIELKINGTIHKVEANPDMPLLWAIRDLVGMTGTKFGCGMALCGACTIHLDGVAIRSCVSPVSMAEGKSLTTIEGIPQEHPIKQAWNEHNVPQCGYCQPGQIMSACALLKQNAHPSESDVENAMAGNICRCGTYPRIKKAILSAAKSTHSSPHSSPHSKKESS